MKTIQVTNGHGNEVHFSLDKGILTISIGDGDAPMPMYMFRLGTGLQNKLNNMLRELRRQRMIGEPAEGG
jgi:hypothetical protein